MEIKVKIAKLLALSRSPNENEARAALLKAQRLMVKHKLTEKDVLHKNNSQVIEQLTGITCTKMTHAWAPYLSAVIAENYCCKAYRVHEHGAKIVEIGFIGLQDDFDICKVIFKYAFDYVSSKCKRIKTLYKKDYTPAQLRKLTNAYGTGFAKGLKDAFQKQQAEHQEWGLVLVTPFAVMKHLENMGKPTSFVKADCSSDDKIRFAQEGYHDGKNFDLSMKLTD